MIEAIQCCAHDNNSEKEVYYRLFYQTTRDKLHLPTVHYRSLLLRLLGDKNYDKVCEAVSKVEKSYAHEVRQERPKGSAIPIRSGHVSSRILRCFYCQKPGHFKVNCYKMKNDLKVKDNRPTY
jgi:hypothetical protein